MDLLERATFEGVNSKTLIINNPPLDLDGTLLRCEIVENLICENFTDSILLSVRDNTSTKDLTEFGVKLFPNPSGGNITIQLNKVVQGHLAIYNLAGQDMVHQDFNASQIELNLHDLSSGVYVLKLTAKDANLIAVNKLILQD